MKIFIDNGHGLMTAGKRSPDGQFREAFYNREIAKRVVADLVDRGYDAELLVPEDDDISLAERVRRVNAACFLLGKQNVILISIHVNAAGDGTRWHTATGWSCYTCKGHTQSDTLADSLYHSAQQHLPGRRIRTDYTDNDPDWEENFFMDNKKDLACLLSQEGRRAIVETIIVGIERCVLTSASG